LTSPDREFDVIVQGATGFTGRLTAEYLARRHGVDGPLRWAIAGRNAKKLEEVRSGLAREVGFEAGELPTVVGDAGEPRDMQSLAERTRAVCTTVGPYAKYGTSLVEACVDRHTHYCDLTGEVQWIRKMIDAHHDAARESGTRLVFTCGFDCIPADLGVWFLQREMKARRGAPAAKVKMRVAGFSGGASGGTIASMLHMLEEAGEDRDLFRILQHPYSLNPKAERTGPDSAEPTLPAFDPDFEKWTAPFMMGAIDTKVVRRSNALLGYAYGRDFCYDEAMLMGSGPTGWATASAAALGSAVGMAAMALGPIRRVVSGRLPQPGTGPSKETREQGHFELLFLAEHPEDRALDLRARVRGDRDPGYGSTSKMLGESAVCLALDDLDSEGGALTPAAAMGDRLIERLEKHAGVSFEILDGAARARD